MLPIYMVPSGIATIAAYKHRFGKVPIISFFLISNHHFLQNRPFCFDKTMTWRCAAFVVLASWAPETLPNPIVFFCQDQPELLFGLQNILLARYTIERVWQVTLTVYHACAQK